MERTLQADGKSENTIYSYTLSVHLLAEFLEKRKPPPTIDVIKDDLRDFLATQRKNNSPATGLVRSRAFSSSSGTLSRRRSSKSRPWRE